MSEQLPSTREDIYSAVKDAITYAFRFSPSIEDMPGLPGRMLMSAMVSGEDILFDRGVIRTPSIPSHVRLTSASDLHVAYEAVNEMAQIPIPSVSSLIDHEVRHGSVAKQRGFQTIHFGLNFHRDGQSGITCTPEAVIENPAKPITILENAAILAAPLQPSPYDLSIISGLGYESCDQLRTAISTHNHLFGDDIPLPEF